MIQTPKQVGFHMPAEWEEHSAIWLAWPHDKLSFPKLEKVEADVVKIMVNNNNFISMEEIDKLYTNKNIFLRNENALIFNKKSTGYTFSEEALDLIKIENKNLK
jgi:agmatine/peptidylarginine deiminase